MKTIILEKAKTHEEFLAKRKEGVGASDIVDLLELSPYSCRRKLYLDKLGLLWESISAGSYHTERGRFLESPIAELYAERMDRSLEELGSAYLEDAPWIRASADRLVYDYKSADKNTEGLAPGLLEIKAPSVFSFKKIRSQGIPEAYKVQLQYQLGVYGKLWGSVAIYCAELHELVTEDFQRDEALIDHLFQKATQAWNEIEKLRRVPTNELLALLPPLSGSHNPDCPCLMFSDSPPALRDEAVERSDLTEEVAFYQLKKEEAKTIERDLELLRSALDLKLEGNTAKKILTNTHEITISERSREGLSTKIIPELTEEQKKKYVSRTEYTQMTIKERK